MRGFILIALIAAAYTASAVPLDQNEPKFVYNRFIQFPDGDGVMHEVDLEAEPENSILSRGAADNTYLLFTRRNPTTAQELKINDAFSVWESNFNPEESIVVIVHGWLSSQNTDINPTIRDAYLGKSDVNVIVLDWSSVATTVYTSAVRGVPEVGTGLGQFLAFLSSVTGVPYSQMHLVGFSLGAHVVGNAGRFLGGRVARVTGLDPAGPLFKYSSNALNVNDGLYVEAIHTDGGYTHGGLGIGSAIARADFFPNGGISQPGCFSNVCYHNRAWELFAATVSYNHLIGNECDSSLQITLNRCRGQELHMGNDDLRKYGSGMYRVSTARKYPF